MTDDPLYPPWLPAAFAEQFKETSEEITDQQYRFFDQLMSAGKTETTNGLGSLGSLSREAAVFKTRVQSGGRISIPDAEREALDIEERDLVQVFVVPIDHNKSETQ